MNKRLIFLCWMIFHFSNPVSSQAPQYCLAIREYVDGHATRNAAYIELMIDNNRKKADQDGNIFFTPETNNAFVMVNMPDEREYVLLGSSNIPLPADQKQSITVIVRKPTQKEQALSQISKELNSMHIRMAQLDSIKNADNTQYLQKMKMLDSILQLATGKYQISESDLRSATEKMQGKDKYFDLISVTLERYLNEVKDIRDIFKHMLAFSLENPKSFRLFDSTINVYNNAYNQLNDHNDEYEKAVLDYWESKELSLGFHNVFDFAINNIHRASILPLNELLNKKVREYLHEDNRGKRKQLKEEIISTLNGITPILDNSLTILETKIRYFVGELESQKNVYST
ncbi:MAG: hypothetical protein ACHQET_04300 [Chitinophagales bacterium]